MRFLFSLILTLFAITAQSQVMKLTSAGKPISISIDDIVFVRAGTPSGSVITYGQTQARLNVSQTMSAIQSASCSNLVSLSVVENISGQPQSTTLLFNVRMIAEVIPDANNKAVMTIRTSPRVKYTTVSSYTSVTNTISACITGGGGGGSVVTDATLSGDGSSGDPLSVNPIGTSLIENNAVTNGKLATMPALTIKGNNTGATGAALDLTKVQVQSMLSVDDLITLTGVAEGNTNLLTFTGTIIPNNSTIKAALQALETAVEIIGDTITVSDSPKIDLTMLNRNITATLVPGGVALTDIAASGASNGQIIKFNGTNWVVGSDVTGSSIDSSFQKLAGIVAGGYANKRYTDNKWSRGKMLIGFNPTNYVSLDTLGQIVIAPPATGTTTAILFKQSGSANSILKTDGSNPFELDGPYTILKSTGSNPFIEFSTLSNGTYRIDYNSALFRLYNQGASKSMLSIHTSAANNALFVDASTNLVVGGTSTAIAKIQAYTTSGATSSMLGMLNSTGTTRFFRSNATPEAAITGIVGDWTFSTTGLFAKITGSGNTGWGEYMNLKKSHGATSGQLLKWNGTTWVPAADDGNVYTGGVGISVAGTVINNDGVTSINGEIGDVVDYVKLTDPVGGTGGDVTGTIDNMIVIGLSGTPIDGTPPTLGQVLAFDGTNWIPTTTGSGGGGITNFTAAQGAAPGVAASSHDGETFRNDVYGELWGSNGSVWYPFSYGGKECQDTVLVSAITVQPGGSVTTGSPLVRSSLGVWEHLYNYATPNTIPDGVVTDVVSGPRAIIQYCGVRKGSGATPNSSYYVDQSANTGFTTTKPASNIRPLGKIASNGDFLVNAGLLFSKDNFPGIIKNGSLSGSGIVGDTLRISTGDKGDVDVTNNGLTWTVDTNAITTVKILDAAVTMAKIAQSGATTGQVLKWNGTAWAPGADGGSLADSTLAKIDGTYLYKRITDNVYKYGTLGLRTTDTIGVLNISESGGTKPMVNLNSNSTWLLNSPPDTRANSGLIQNWAIAKSFYDSASASGDNQVVFMGFNVGAGGIVKDATKAAMWIAMENSFNNPGQQRAYEFHFPQITYPGGIVRRPFSSYISNDVGILAGFSSSTNDNLIFSDFKTGTQRAFWAFGEKGTYQPYDKGLTFVDTAIIKFSVNNVGGLLQRNAANSADIQLIKANSSNEVVLGGANESRIVASQHLNISGAALITGSSGFLNVGSASFPTSYIVTTNTSEIARLVRTGETYYNSFHIASGIFQMISSSGAQPFSMSLAAPSQSLYIVASGRVGLGINAPQARLQIESALNQQEKMMRLKNTTGFNDIFRSNVSPFNNVGGNPGDLAVVSDGTNGSLYGKYSGTGGSGWAKFLNLVDPNAATPGQILGWNGTTWGPVSASSAGAWGTSGNAATTANFIGSTSNVGLRFRTNNIQYMILDSLGRLGVNVALPTARINVAAGTAAAGTSPIKFTTTGAVLLTTPEAGVLEVGASDNRIYYTGSSATRNTIAYLTDSLAVSLLKKGSATTNQVIKWNGTNWAPATDVSLANTDQTLTANRAIALGTNSLTVSSSVVADQSITATFNNDGIVMSALDASGADDITGEIFLSGAFASIGVDNGVSATSYTNYQDASSTWKWNDITITLNAANGISIANAETNDGMKYTANNENAILLTDRNVPDMNTVRRNNRERFTDVTSTTSPVNLTSTNKDNLINQGGTQATFTFSLPATPGDGQICELTFSNIVTTLTITAQGGITILGNTASNAIVGTQLRYKYYAAITSWIRIL